MSPATIGISLLLVAAGLSLTGRKAAIILGYVIGFALLALFLTVGAGCLRLMVSVHGLAADRQKARSQPMRRR
jgi:hypothetical protein